MCTLRRCAAAAIAGLFALACTDTGREFQRDIVGPVLDTDGSSSDVLYSRTAEPTAAEATVESHQVIVTQLGGKEFVKVTFEGGGNAAPIHPPTGLIPGSGMRFPGGWLTLIDSDAGGSGNFANEPSPQTVAFWSSGSTQTVTFDQAVCDVSLFYSSTDPVTLRAFDAGGSQVAVANGPAQYNQGPGGDPTGNYNLFSPLGVDVCTSGLSGNVITSVTFSGRDLHTAIDDFETSRVIVIPVDIDIKPGDDPNCFNNDGHGVIPVAILGTADFDVTTVDPSTVKLASLAVRAVGLKGNLQALIEDVNEDGFDDLVVQIEDVDGAFTNGNGTATLTGNLKAEFGGTPILGTDEICIVP
jgi:hypothetical protein